MTPSVLLAHSVNWPNVARLAGAFRKEGFVVDAIAPEGDPVHQMRSPYRTYVYRPRNGWASLREAIEASRPHLVVPCDERMVAHLSALRAVTSGSGRPDRWMSDLIEASLGPAESHAFLTKRSSLAKLAELPEVSTPQTDAIGSFWQLGDWIRSHGLPAVLKLDGSSGGRDVVVIHDRASAAKAYFNIRMRKSLLRRLKTATFDRDVESLLNYFKNAPVGVIVQSFVTGRLANCAVACWRGEVLACVAVEVVRSPSTFAAATVVRLVEGRAMEAAARSIVGHLSLSGFCGFDFVIDDKWGEPKLIEINARATQINHLERLSGADLPAALHAALEGRMRPTIAENTRLGSEIALFPQEWVRDPAGFAGAADFQDVPWDEPEYLKFYNFLLTDRSVHASATLGEATASGQIAA